MKRKHLLLLPAAAIAGAVFAQGPLTPPGAPAAVMKTLAQVEPRTPISSLPFTISQSGSYYLTRSLAVATGDAVTIAVNDVTLDLNGFTLSSMAPGPGSGTAVLLTSSKPENIVIRNGHIRSTTALSGLTFFKGGFQNGIGLSSVGVSDSTVRVSDVNVAGAAGNGIFFPGPGNTLVERCSVQTCVDTGIAGAVIRHCSVTEAGKTALEGRVVSHSMGRCIGNLSGAAGIRAEIVESCEGVGISGHGIWATTVSNSTGTSLNGWGIIAFGAASNSSGTSTSATGLHAEYASNCTGTSDSAVGMWVVQNAVNCVGTSTSGFGVRGYTATNCYGKSTSGPGGLNLNGAASFCRGSRAGGLAVSALIAIGCIADDGTVSAGQKHLGTP